MLEQAAAIFARRGVDFSTATRAGGWTNATWLAGGLALRLSTRPGGDSLRREARLAVLLPPEAGCPPQLESGVTADGLEWSLAVAVPGQSLGEAWPALDWPARCTALRGLWQKMQVVHTVNPAAARGLARSRAWYNSTDPDEAEAGLARLLSQDLLNPQQAAHLRAALVNFWQALAGAPRVLNHGDLTLDNVLWNAGAVVALLDFEFAVIAPPELDINTFLKHALGPEDAQALPAEHIGRQVLRRAAITLASPALSAPGSPQRLLGYAILLELWLLEDWLAHPEGEDPDVQAWEPYRRLISLADGQGGYLAPILDQLL